MRSYVFPGDIDPAIMAIGAKPFLYMRTDAFSQINKESEQIHGSCACGCAEAQP